MTKVRGFNIPPISQLHWYGVDLDKTLAEDVWRPEATKSFIGDPLEENVNKLMDVIVAGFDVHIHTSRPWSEFEMVKAWLRKNDITAKQIQMGKPLYHRYVDDRAINASAASWL